MISRKQTTNIGDEDQEKDKELQKQLKEQRRKENFKKYQWQKGICPNPKGRPKDWTTIIRETLDKTIMDHGEEKTVKQALTDKMTEMALTKGNLKAMQELMNRDIGKPRETHDINLTGNLNLTQLSDEELDKRITELSQRIETLERTEVLPSTGEVPSPPEIKM